MNPDIKFFNAFNSIPGVGPATLRLLKFRFGIFREAWFASEPALQEAGVETQPLQAILWKRPSLNPDQLMQKLISENIWILDCENPHFPSYLKEITNAPLAIYGRGKLENKFPALAVVGTRRPTHYGLEACENIVNTLALAGVAIVSGLATGIDGRAHETALDAKGYTVAVLGSGVDRNSIFPSEHVGLARRIADAGGAVISEYAPETPATKEHFPARNRIISGLSRGVLVIEAREKSGALITARFALEQNRDVFAVPGSIFSPTSQGPNRLIQEGAKLIRNAEDILEELGIEYNKITRERALENMNENEMKILALLEEPLTVDAIKDKSVIATPVIIATLSMLELKGLVKNLGQGAYQKISNA